MNEDELLECPMCNSNDINVIYTAEIAIGYEVYCNTCGLGFDHVFDIKEEAVAAWNSRVFPEWLRENIEDRVGDNGSDYAMGYDMALRWVLTLTPSSKSP